MDPHRSSHPPQDYSMYDDRPYEDARGSAPQGFETSWKDNTRTPPRGHATANMAYNPSYPDSRDEYRYDHDRGRSRSPRREGRGRYTDRDREGYRSPRRDRSRSRSPYFGGAPNRNVILEGLPAQFTQEDFSLNGKTRTLAKNGIGHFGLSTGLQILHELQHSLRVEGLEEVRLIKDKKTGQSRQFAFAQFVSIDDAREFLEHHYPTLSLFGPYDPAQNTTAQPAKVRIAYSREREERDKAGKSEDDWKCEVCYLPNFSHRTLCFRCNAPRTRPSAHGVVLAQANMSSYSGFATTGDSDASPDDTASQFLLLRGLEPGVNEELLAKGVSKLYKTKAGTPPKDTHATKKTKITSTSNDSSLGSREGSLRRVLLVRDRKSDESWRYGFAEFNTVEDAQAAIAKYKAADRFTISSKPVMVSYIHAGVFVPVLNPSSSEPERFTFSPLLNSAIKLMYWDESAYVNELTITSVEPPSKAKLQEVEASKRATAAANEGLVGGPTRDIEPRSKKRKVEKDNRVIAPHLQFWSNRHAEIHGIPSKDSEDPASESTGVPPVIKKEDDPNGPPPQSFADMTRKCCLLCARQFKTAAEVNKHERISQLHRDNMKNKELVTKALAKLNKSNDTSDNSAYRDRAKERRQAFNQPKQPAAQHNRGSKASAGVDSVSKQETEPDEPVQSKGAALLGKMGWSAGEGLGAQGTGRTSAITTDLYSAGVGLGAQGGKLGDAMEEAQRQTTSSYADFLNKTKDKAKERFHSLN